MVLDLNFILKVGLALLTAAVLAFAVTPLVKKLAQKVGAIDVPTDDRRMHHTPIPRMGGLAIFIAFLTSVLIFAKIDIKELLIKDFISTSIFLPSILILPFVFFSSKF